jgi:hypothetical protein
MVNQNPQPEFYTTRHDFVNGNGQGTVVTQEVYTNQSFNEEVRIYGVMIQVVDEDGDALSYSDLQTQGTYDFDLTIQAGPNRIPSSAFSASRILRANDRTLAFSSPVLILHRQPLQVSVEYRGSSSFTSGENLTFVVTLISEIYIRQE